MMQDHNQTETQNQPATTIRLGAIKAAIWQNETEFGSRYSVTFDRLYKEGDEWKRSRSFDRDDLLVLAKLAHRAHSRIFQLQAEKTAGIETA